LLLFGCSACNVNIALLGRLNTSQVARTMASTSSSDTWLRFALNQLVDGVLCMERNTSAYSVGLYSQSVLTRKRVVGS
jgi:hypothetical protein